MRIKSLDVKKKGKKKEKRLYPNFRSVALSEGDINQERDGVNKPVAGAKRGGNKIAVIVVLIWKVPPFELPALTRLSCRRLDFVPRQSSIPDDQGLSPGGMQHIP